MLHNNYKMSKNDRIHPLIAGIAGAIVGAAGISLFLLSDKEIRKKVLKKAHQWKITLEEWSNEKLGNIDPDEILDDTDDNVHFRTKENTSQKSESN